MKSIRKTHIYNLSLELLERIKIAERNGSILEGINKEGMNVIFDSSIPNLFYSLDGEYIISNPCVKAMTFHDRLYHTDAIPYPTDLDASVAYARAMEQLNNPNVEFVSF